MNLEVLNLVHKNEYCQREMDRTYETLKRDLTQIVSDKEQLKHRVNEEVTSTSDYMKEMAFRKTKSQERVKQEEMKN